MALTNEKITFKGEPLPVSGRVVQVGDTLPDFVLTGTDMGDVKADSFHGKILIISVVPSLDTPVCAVQTKRFNQEAANLSDDVVILTVSRDLPFAQKRWCGVEGVERLVCASDFKYRTFGQAFGVELDSWGLLARALFVADPNGRVVYADYVSEISEEPDYESALKAVRELK